MSKSKRRFLAPGTLLVLALNVVLMLVGWVIILLWSTNAISVAIGTSIVATGIASTVTYWNVTRNEETTNRLAILQEFGFVNAFERRGMVIQDEYNSRLLRARHNIDVIGFGLASLLADYGDDFALWKERAHVRIMLIDPDFPNAAQSFAAQRELEEGIPKASLRAEVEKFIATKGDLIGTSKHGSFEIRYYQCLPAVNICRIDNDMLWGPYLSRQLSRNSPTFVVRRGGILYEQLLDHFERIWKDDKLSRPI